MCTFWKDPVIYLHAVPGDITHLVFFGEVLEWPVRDNNSTFRPQLEQAGWGEAWRTHWNGLDILQDDGLRRGGIYVFERDSLRREQGRVELD